MPPRVVNVNEFAGVWVCACECVWCLFCDNFSVWLLQPVIARICLRFIFFLFFFVDMIFLYFACIRLNVIIVGLGIEIEPNVQMEQNWYSFFCEQFWKIFLMIILKIETFVWKVIFLRHLKNTRNTCYQTRLHPSAFNHFPLTHPVAIDASVRG